MDGGTEMAPIGKGRLSAGNSRVRVSAFGLMHVCVCVQRYLVQ